MSRHIRAYCVSKRIDIIDDSIVSTLVREFDRERRERSYTRKDMYEIYRRFFSFIKKCNKNMFGTWKNETRLLRSLGMHTYTYIINLRKTLTC